MDCKKVRQKLSQHYDGELTSKENSVIVNHLRECGTCRSELEDIRAVSRAIRLRSQNVPRIWDRIERHLAAAEGKAKRTRRRVLVTVSAAVGATAILFLLTFDPGPGGTSADTAHAFLERQADMLADGLVEDYSLNWQLSFEDYDNILEYLKGLPSEGTTGTDGLRPGNHSGIYIKINHKSA